MGERKKRRLAKQAARVERVKTFIADILSAIISGLITAAILKWWKW